MKKYSIAILIVFILGLIFSLSAVFVFSQGASRFYGIYEAEITISRGTSIKALASELKEKKLILNEDFFYLLARQSKTLVKAGVYSVSNELSMKEMLSLFSEGRDSQIRLTIPEGYTLSKIAVLLDQKGITSYEEFMAESKNEALLKKYAIPSDTVEGYVFPDTYFFSPQMEAKRVLEKMIDTFFLKISPFIEEQKLSPKEVYDTIILASIVEKEYQREEEAPLIASVFLNRLKYNIGLYSCATIVYILTEIEGREHPSYISEKDTKIQSPFNTYMYAGLPPNPIANPGLVALKAAFEPAVTDYYYFRLIDEATGKHSFSKNFDEHIEVGRKILK
jgi:UPF0755 protein